MFGERLEERVAQVCIGRFHRQASEKPHPHFEPEWSEHLGEGSQRGVGVGVIFELGDGAGRHLDGFGEGRAVHRQDGVPENAHRVAVVHGVFGDHR